MGATVRHTNGCMDDAIMSAHLIQSYSNRLSYQFQTCRNDNCSSRKATICLIFHLIAESAVGFETGDSIIVAE